MDITSNSSDPDIPRTVELLRRARDGDRDCLHALIERYRRPLLDRIRLMMGERARTVAESGDFLNEVFVEVLQHFENWQLDSHKALLRWITHIARNDIRDEVRRKRETAMATFTSSMFMRSPDQATPKSEVERREQLERVADAVQELPEDHRHILELRHFEGESFTEIARLLDRSRNAVQLLHARALAALGKLLR